MWFELIVRYFILYFVFTLIYFGLGAIINTIQCILYFTVRTFNKRLYRKINYYLCYIMYSQVIFISERYCGSDIYIYADKNDLKYHLGKEHAFVILNHTYDLDWLYAGILSEKFGCAGNYKAFIKKVVQYFPGIGWSLYFSENVFLERSFDKDKLVIENQIRQLVDHPDPVWLTLYPEGTRFTPSKHEVCLKFARENNLPEYKHHLTPRVKGFLTSLPPMRGKMGAIYDVTLSFNPNAKSAPTLLNTFLGRKLEGHIYIKRIPFEAVPEDENEASKFLYDMFERKDKLQESFFNTGDYFATSGIKREDPIYLKPRYSILICQLLSHSIILIPTIYYLYKLFISNIILVFGIFVTIIILVYVILAISCKGSSYGIVKKTKFKHIE